MMIIQALIPTFLGGLLAFLISWLIPRIPWVKSYWAIQDEYRRTCPIDIRYPLDNKRNARNKFPLPTADVVVTLISCYILIVVNTFGGMFLTCVRLSS